MYYIRNDPYIIMVQFYTTYSVCKSVCNNILFKLKTIFFHFQFFLTFPVNCNEISPSSNIYLIQIQVNYKQYKIQINVT